LLPLRGAGSAPPARAEVTMAGPVWRFEREVEAACATCFRKVVGVFTEGEIVANEIRASRHVCPDCYGSAGRMLVRGELGRSVGAPGYAHR
jgi:hypothetical protein